MNIWTGLLFLGGFIATPAALAAVTGEAEPQSPKEIVRNFLANVRRAKHRIRLRNIYRRKCSRIK